MRKVCSSKLGLRSSGKVCLGFLWASHGSGHDRSHCKPKVKEEEFVEAQTRTQKMKKRYVYPFADGDGHDKKLLGGKGANLCQMTQIGINVPPGFVITTEACLDYLQ